MVRVSGWKYSKGVNETLMSLDNSRNHQNSHKRKERYNYCEKEITGNGIDAGGSIGNSSPGAGNIVITNPYGKKGGPAHQSAVASIQPISPTGKISYEVKYNTPNGSKSCRYADAVEISNGEITQIYQVGRVKKMERQCREKYRQ